MFHFTKPRVLFPFLPSLLRSAYAILGPWTHPLLSKLHCLQSQGQNLSGGTTVQRLSLFLVTHKICHLLGLKLIPNPFPIYAVHLDHPLGSWHLLLS